MIELIQSARPAIFIGLFLVFACWEVLSPRRSRGHPLLRRWLGNIGILAVGTVLARLILPLAPVSVAVWADQAGVGILNAVKIQPVVAGIFAFLILDLLIYGQHVAFHRIPVLWRIHRMHHSDLDLDTSSGLRFHPLEIIFSLVLKMAAVAVLGAPVLSVLLFEVVLNATSMFNHSSINIPANVDRILRRVVVTPDMHRVHHSVYRDETDSNFGFNIPWWDRALGTYKDQPRDGHGEMQLGLPDLRDQRCAGLINLLMQPFVKIIPASRSATREPEN